MKMIAHTEKQIALINRLQMSSVLGDAYKYVGCTIQAASNWISWALLEIPRRKALAITYKEDILGALEYYGGQCYELGYLNVYCGIYESLYRAKPDQLHNIRAFVHGVIQDLYEKYGHNKVSEEDED